jgi:hypothetical protein
VSRGVSERSIRRANERRAAKERRRQALRRRRTGLATGAAIGATALFAPGAQAASFTVDVLADGPADACTPGACKLRDALEQANTSADPSDTITFAPGLTGQIVLTDQLEIIGPDITIDGPGRDVISISGDADNNGLDDGDFRIFTVSGPSAAIDGLTLTEGRAFDGTDAGDGGAVRVTGTGALELTASAITGSTSLGEEGGGIYVDSETTATIDDTLISGNEGGDGGGIGIGEDAELLLTDSQVTGNESALGSGAGLSAYDSTLTVERSTISGNTGARYGGGIYSGGRYAPLDVVDSVISDNEAKYGGGVDLEREVPSETYFDRSIVRTTIAGNTATFAGGGLYVGQVNPGDNLTISHSAISGNTAEGEAGQEGVGGGIALAQSEVGGVVGNVVVANSTLSGNTADAGGGAAIGSQDGSGGTVYGILDFANSTIASNTATRTGGGIYLSSYSVGEEEYTSATPLLTSTIVANNTAAGAAQDLDQAENADGGGFDSAFSLIETPGDAPILQAPGDANILGSDPQLGALGDNGGPTQTHLPAVTSPAIDKGDAVPRDATDQRGVLRTQDGTGIPNPEGGDGTDIGSVEIDRVQAQQQQQQQQQTTQEQQPPAQQPGQQQQQPPPPPPPAAIIRRSPSGLTIRTTPRRDLDAPWRFRSTGRVLPPAGMSAAEACRTVGIVTVQIKRNGTTISNRRAVLKPDCTYESVVTFRFRQRFGRVKNLKFTARFGGNQLLEPITSRSLLRRVQ